MFRLTIVQIIVFIVMRMFDVIVIPFIKIWTAVKEKFWKNLDLPSKFWVGATGVVLLEIFVKFLMGL